jgi:hypothetical protein
MRRYLLDSGPLAGYITGNRRVTALVSPMVTAREAVTSILVYGEVTELLRGLPHPARQQTHLHRVMRTNSTP